jgi:small neutral amino acid transporter SnatA (MarC family)
VFTTGCIVLSIIITGIISYIVISHSHSISERLGNNGKNVLERIMGLLVLVIGVQMLINGAQGVLQLWGIIA